MRTRRTTMGVAERREREKLQRRREIIEGAEELFFTRGFERTKMVEVAEAVELSKGTLYLYFKSKEQLAYAILIRSFDTLISLLEEAAGGAEHGIDKVHAMARAYVAFYRDHYRQFYFMQIFENILYDTLTREEEGGRFYDRLQRIKGVVIEAVRRGLDDGSLRSDIEPELSAITYMIAADGFMHQMITRSLFIKRTTTFSKDELIEELFRILVHSIT
ncbi:MAG: TetR/AcrR family transcriptional regulator [Alkalispirochaetaceae bacterium]